MQSLKIIILTDVFLPYKGGGQFWVQEIAHRLISSHDNIQVEIVTRKLLQNNSCTFKNEELFNGRLKITRLGYCSSWNDIFSRILFIFQSFFYLLNKDFDLIDAQAFISGVPACFIAVVKNKPVVFTVHGTNMDRGQASFLEKILLTKIKYAAQISVAASFIKYPNVNKKIFIVRPGVDLTKFMPRAEMREKNRILFVGRLCKEKGIDTLIKIITNVKNTAVKFIIIGDGPEKDNLKTYVADHHLKFVEVINALPQDQLVQEYQKADIFVLPSHFEGFPLSILEAKACGVVVVAANIGDTGKLIKSGVNGFLVEHDDVQGFQNAILKLIEDENLKRNCQRQNIKEAADYSWDKSAEKILTIYSDLVSQNIRNT